MTDRSALTQARTLWGNKAAVQRYPSGKHLVGYIALGVAFNVCGVGLTWEEAFKNARACAKSLKPPTEKKKLTRGR